MRPDFVVVDPPFFDYLAGVADAIEPAFVQALVAEFAIEALHVAVLLRLAGLDERVLHCVAIAPLVQGHACELGAVVRVDPLGPAVTLDQVVEDPGLRGVRISRCPPQSKCSAWCDRPPRLASSFDAPSTWRRARSPCAISGWAWTTRRSRGRGPGDGASASGAGPGAPRREISDTYA